MVDMKPAQREIRNFYCSDVGRSFLAHKLSTVMGHVSNTSDNRPERCISNQCTGHAGIGQVSRCVL